MSNANFKSNIKRVKYQLTENEMAALKEIRKFIIKKIKARIKKHTGRLKRSIKSRIYRKDKSLEIGIAKKAFYGSFIEFGTKKIRAKSFIISTIKENMSEINKIIYKNFRNMR